MPELFGKAANQDSQRRCEDSSHFNAVSPTQPIFCGVGPCPWPVAPMKLYCHDLWRLVTWKSDLVQNVYQWRRSHTFHHSTKCWVCKPVRHTNVTVTAHFFNFLVSALWTWLATYVTSAHRVHSVLLLSALSGIVPVGLHWLFPNSVTAVAVVEMLFIIDVCLSAYCMLAEFTVIVITMRISSFVPSRVLLKKLKKNCRKCMFHITTSKFELNVIILQLDLQFQSVAVTTILLIISHHIYMF